MLKKSYDHHLVQILRNFRDTPQARTGRLSVDFPVGWTENRPNNLSKRMP